ncbi:MAG TPA: carbohydrate ABC transporter permease [Clostridiales bacterium]|nr:carbohydrate ABC transporter permease [Clostridiales bacterium]
MNMKHKLGFNFYDVFVYAFTIAFAIFCIYPMWYVFIGSITPSASSAQQPLRILPPHNPTLEYYNIVLHAKEFKHSMFISFLKTIVGAIGSLIFTAMMAYGVSKRQVMGMKTLNFIIVFFMFFSGGLIPTYLLYGRMHLLKTFWVMVIPGFISIGHFVIMRNYFCYNVPEDLESAAVIDGANNIIIFFKIIIPISMPMFAAIFLFEAVGHWNDWTSYLYFVGEVKYMPFIVVLQEILRNPNGQIMRDATATVMNIQQRTLPPASLINTTIIVAMLPILVIYPFLQKHFAKGILIGAVKG